ncbi:MAG: hypothetical protein ACYDHH_09270 [Solirubrobacteraceae bacterium]
MIEFDDSNRRGMRRDPGRPDRPQRRAAQLARDAALRRVALTRTGVIVSSAGLTVGFVVLVADTAPGKTYKTSSRSSAAGKTAAPTAASLPPLETPGQLGLPAASTGAASSTATQPAAAATATQPVAGGQGPPAQAPVVSGGS